MRGGIPGLVGHWGEFPMGAGVGEKVERVKWRKSGREKRELGIVPGVKDGVDELAYSH